MPHPDDVLYTQKYPTSQDTSKSPRSVWNEVASSVRRLICETGTRSFYDERDLVTRHVQELPCSECLSTDKNYDGTNHLYVRVKCGACKTVLYRHRCTCAR